MNTFPPPPPPPRRPTPVIPKTTPRVSSRLRTGSLRLLSSSLNKPVINPSISCLHQPPIEPVTNPVHQTPANGPANMRWGEMMAAMRHRMTSDINSLRLMRFSNFDQCVCLSMVIDAVLNGIQGGLEVEQDLRVRLVKALIVFVILGMNE